MKDISNTNPQTADTLFTVFWGWYSAPFLLVTNVHNEVIFPSFRLEAEQLHQHVIKQHRRVRLTRKWGMDKQIPLLLHITAPLTA